MKKIILFLFAAALFLTSCGPSTNDAVNFNDSLVAAQKACINSEKDFYKSCNGLDAAEIKKAYESFNTTVDASLKTLQSLKEEKEFTNFKENALSLVGAYKKLMPQEYNEYAKIYAMPAETYTLQDSIRCVEVAAKINTTLNPLVTGFISAQEAFAKEWNFTLTGK